MFAEKMNTVLNFFPLPIQAAWKHAIEKAKSMPDPWAVFHLEDVETEPCVRYRSAI